MIASQFIHLEIAFGFGVEDQLLFSYEALFLAVERQVVHVFIGQDHGQKAGPGGCPCLYPLGKLVDFHSITAFSSIFIADIP